MVWTRRRCIWARLARSRIRDMNRRLSECVAWAGPTSERVTTSHHSRIAKIALKPSRSDSRVQLYHDGRTGCGTARLSPDSREPVTDHPQPPGAPALAPKKSDYALQDSTFACLHASVRRNPRIVQAIRRYAARRFLATCGARQATLAISVLATLETRNPAVNSWSATSCRGGQDGTDQQRATAGGGCVIPVAR